MDEKGRKLLGVICEGAKGDPQAVYDVLLSTGQTIEGELSPFDDQSDHIRVNPVAARTDVSKGPEGKGLQPSSYFVMLDHIVYVRRKPPLKPPIS